MAVKGRDDEYAFVVERPRPATLARVIMHAHGLTEREQQIAVAVLHGATSRHIARDFGVSVHTVNDHIEAIYGKLGVGSRGELSARLLTAHLPQRARGADAGAVRMVSVASRRHHRQNDRRTRGPGDRRR